MLRVAAGDAEAFRLLVERVLPRLLAHFRRLGADGAEAEDCAQETLLKVYRARDRYQPQARFVTYLFHVARNHWIDVVRHRGARPKARSTDVRRPDGTALSGDLPARPSPPEDPGRAAELRVALDRALAGLTAEHREVFLLAQVEGLKYGDIGEILGIPVGTVKSRMHAAVHLLRDVLAREGFEP
jgi:RNA polymerase sigma-70 factor (ECF subfamily)